MDYYCGFFSSSATWNPRERDDTKVEEKEEIERKWEREIESVVLNAYPAGSAVPPPHPLLTITYRTRARVKKPGGSRYPFINPIKPLNARALWYHPHAIYYASTHIYIYIKYNASLSLSLSLVSVSVLSGNRSRTLHLPLRPAAPASVFSSLSCTRLSAQPPPLQFNTSHDTHADLSRN